MTLFKTVSYSSFRWIQRVQLWSALLGLFASVYLLIVYVSGAPIVCGLISGCDTVRASRWAFIYGIPRPALGILFYIGILKLITLRSFFPRWRVEFVDRIFLLFATIGVVESARLTLIEWLDIKAFCFWCIISAVVNVILFISAFLIPHERPDTRQASKSLKEIVISLFIALLIGGAGIRALLVQGEGPKVTTLDQSVSSVLLPPGVPVEGPVTSTVLVVEFLDFQCPSCGQLHPIMKRIRQDYAGKIRYAQRMFPLVEIHEHAKAAAIAAQCAAKQNRYFEYADALMANQQHLTTDDVIHYAEALRLNVEAFRSCLSDPSVESAVMAERKAGEALQVDSTPTTFINNTMVPGLATYEELKKIIDAALSL